MIESPIYFKKSSYFPVKPDGVFSALLCWMTSRRGEGLRMRIIIGSFCDVIQGVCVSVGSFHEIRT